MNKMNKHVVGIDQLAALRAQAQREQNERAIAIRLTVGGWAAQFLAGCGAPSPEQMQRAVVAAYDLHIAVDMEAERRIAAATAATAAAPPAEVTPIVKEN